MTKTAIAHASQAVLEPSKKCTHKMRHDNRKDAAQLEEAMSRRCGWLCNGEVERRLCRADRKPQQRIAPHLFPNGGFPSKYVGIVHWSARRSGVFLQGRRKGLQALGNPNFLILPTANSQTTGRRTCPFIHSFILHSIYYRAEFLCSLRLFCSGLLCLLACFHSLTLPLPIAVAPVARLLSLRRCLYPDAAPLFLTIDAVQKPPTVIFPLHPPTTRQPGGLHLQQTGRQIARVQSCRCHEPSGFGPSQDTAPGLQSSGAVRRPRHMLRLVRHRVDAQRCFRALVTARPSASRSAETTTTDANSQCPTTTRSAHSLLRSPWTPSGT